MNREEAVKATKNGAIAAGISGAVTLAFVAFAMFTNAGSKSLGIWNDPSNLFDIVLVFCCAYGIYRKSRFAAVLLFVYFILAKTYLVIETGKVSGIGMSLVFLYFFGKAVQGAFSFHKIERAENPRYRPAPKWAYYAGIPALVLFVIVMGMGLMTMTGVIPSTEVQSGADMSEKDKAALVANSVLAPDDRVLYFYSDGFTSVLEGGSVLTEDRVILYLPDEKKDIQVYELPFEEIASVEQVEAGHFGKNSVYRITSRQPDAWMQIALSAENRGDVAFIEELRNRIKEPNL